VGFYGFKNRIINGGMNIDQRNSGAVTTPVTGAYTVDRFYYSASQASKFTVQQTPSATETGYATRVSAGFRNYLACTVSSAFSIGASDYFGIIQLIEGYNSADLAWGTAGAKTVTLSFLVYSSLTGTFGGAIRNSDASRSYPFSYTISSANTWTQISVIIPGDTSGTWLGATNGVGISVIFSLGFGSTFSGTAGAWASANYGSVTGAVSVVGTASATFYITGVQLEKGSTATSFDYRPIGTELMLCQRYFIKISNGGSGNAFANFANPTAYAASASGYRFQIALPVQMRTYPSFSQTGTLALLGADAGTATSVGLADGGGNPVVGMTLSNTATTLGISNILRGGNDTTAALNYSAEL
jgi:hypothetical protein